MKTDDIAAKTPYNTPMSHIHMLGIAGTGMGSLARLLLEKGNTVTGSDEKIYPPMSTQLAEMHIPIFEGYSPDHLTPRPDKVVIGNVIRRDNPEAQGAIDAKIPYFSMAQMIHDECLAGRHSIVVAGTHGKTTTTSIAAWLLEAAGEKPGFMIGGVPTNFGQSARLGRGDFFVIEGDEYDTAFFDKGPKFWHYAPQSLIINAVEFDHADIFANLDAIMAVFRKLISLVPADGLIIADGDQPNVATLIAEAGRPILRTSLGASGDYRAEAVRYDEAGTSFDFVFPGGRAPFLSPMVGEHNLRNVLGVLGCLHARGITIEALQRGLREFRGIKRRQEVRHVVRDITIIDDFAHHPTAVRETLKAIRQRYHRGRMWAIFEPRSNTSRRNVFQHDFATAFANADEVLIASVNNPEKIEASIRLDPSQLAADIQQRGTPATFAETTDRIIEHVANHARAGDVVVVMSNGGFDNIHDRLAQRLEQTI